MARMSYGASLGASLGNGQWVVDAARTGPVTVDISAAIVHLAALELLVVDAKATAATAKVTALACQTANVAVTPVENAIAVLEADGAAPTQGHVNALRTVWDTLSSACTAHNITANTTVTDVTAADVAVKLVLTTDVSSHLGSMTTATTADVILDINASTVTTQAAVKAALKSIMNRVEGGGLAP